MIDHAESPVAAAHRLAADIARFAGEAERARTLPGELVAILNSAGLFRLCVPEELGGREVHPRELMEAVEALGRVDGSTAWCVMVGASSGVVSAYLDPELARQIYRPGTVTGGVYAPLGRAARIPGGYRLNGRWGFASGCLHSDWLIGGGMVEGGGRRQFLFRREEAVIHDTWQVAGLCGTGSHDMEVKDLFVPEARAFDLAADPPRHPGPLYAFPVFGLLALGIAAAALGIARGAIEDLTGLAGAKVPLASRRRLAERPVLQVQVAEAEAELRSARAFLLEAIDGCWQVAVADGAIPLPLKVELRLACAHATRVSARVVDAMYTGAGGNSVYTSSPLQRRLRDIHAATQHMMVGPAVWEVAGRARLGLEVDSEGL